MKYLLFIISLAVSSMVAQAQPATVWTEDDGTVSTNIVFRYRYDPPLVFNKSTGRLLVDAGSTDWGAVITLTSSNLTANINSNFNIFSSGGEAVTPSAPLKVQQGDLNRTNDNVTTYLSTGDSNNLYNVYLYGSSVLTNAVTTGSILTTNTSTTVPVALGTSATVFRTVTFVGYKTGRTINSSTVWIQFSSTDADNAIPLLPGQSLSFPAMDRSVYDASQFYIDVETANDGVMALWVK